MAVGDDIAGVKDNPSDRGALEKLAHEITHVVQARRPGEKSSRTDLEAEAQQAATDMVRGRRPTVRLSAGVDEVLHYDPSDVLDPTPRSKHHNPWQFILGSRREERSRMSESTFGPLYNKLLQTVRDDLREWKKFRGGEGQTGDYDMSRRSGIRSANTALDLKMAVVHANEDFLSVSRSLRKHLTDEEFAALAGLIHFRAFLPGAPFRGGHALPSSTWSTHPEAPVPGPGIRTPP